MKILLIRKGRAIPPASDNDLPISKSTSQSCTKKVWGIRQYKVRDKLALYLNHKIAFVLPIFNNLRDCWNWILKA